jgi:hypothetical protein
MAILDRVRVNPNICAVEVAFRGQLTAANIPDWQQFYNSTMLDLDFTKTHVGLGSVSFGEESDNSAAGTIYKQSVTIRFPTTDENRADRIELLQHVKFLKLKLTNGRDIIIGRNDYLQNARPRIKTKTNIKTAEVEFQTLSMFPSGFVANSDLFYSPALIPLILY